MARRRGFGEVERRRSAAGRVTYRARYSMPDGTRYSRTLGTKLDAEAWLVFERGLVDVRNGLHRRPGRRPRPNARQQLRSTP